MAKNVFDTLEERGYFSQATHREEIYDLLSKPGVSFYIGFDPTADFKDLVTLSGGYIEAGEDCHTNVKGIFAAGDGRTKKVRQLTTACADGAVAALAAVDFIKLG